MAAATSPSATLDPEALDLFSRHAGGWWDPAGPHRMLHVLNPTRLAFIRQSLAPAADPRALQPLKGLRILDLGCGGGLLTEGLARMGAAVTGIDADAAAIAIAQAHAAESGLDALTYHAAELQDVPLPLQDAVIASEVIEHVPDPGLFLDQALAVLKPGGRIVLTTLNRTPLSYALGIVAAEQVLGLAPKGAHQWRRFLKPSELGALLLARGCRVEAVTGMAFVPLAQRFRLDPRRLGINYALAALKGGG